MRVCPKTTVGVLSGLAALVVNSIFLMSYAGCIGCMPRPTAPATDEPAPAPVDPVAPPTLTLTVYGSESCPWCTKLAAEMEKPAAKAALAGFTVAETKAPREAMKARVKAFPTLVVTDHGKELGRHAGYLSAPDLAAWLGKFHQSTEGDFP